MSTIAIDLANMPLEALMQAVSGVDKICSLRLATLHRLHQADRIAFLQHFWSDIDRRGSPLIEPVPDGLTQILVTVVCNANHSIVYLRWLDTEDAPPVSGERDGSRRKRDVCVPE